MKDYNKEKMFAVLFHNDQDAVPKSVADFVRDSFNPEVTQRLERYQQTMAGNILALIFSGDSVFFHTQPFEGSDPALKALVARPFGLKPNGQASFEAFDRFLKQIETFINSTGESTEELVVSWQCFGDFVVRNAGREHNEWAADGHFGPPEGRPEGPPGS